MNLEMINTALALGDPAAPPPGTRVRLLTPPLAWRSALCFVPRRVCIVTDTEPIPRADIAASPTQMYGHRRDLGLLRPGDTTLQGVRVHLYEVNECLWCAPSDFEVLWVPEAAPPFEQWARL